MKVSAPTRRVLRAIADAVLPDQPRMEDTLDVVTTHARVSLQYMPRSSAWVFLLAMWLLNTSPLWRFRGLRPLTSLPRETARAHLVAITQSRWLYVRLLMVGPLGLFMSCYFDQDYVHEALDYDPKPFVEERIQLRRKWLEESDA